MFGWFRPKCPVDTWEKTWVEWRMRWFIHQFGIDRLWQTQVIEPTAEFFPEPWKGTATELELLFGRICQWMSADRNRLEVRLAFESEISAAGIYTREGNRGIVYVASSQLQDLEVLIALLAHEIAHDRLLGESRVHGDESDHEWLTDLLPVFFGLGIFAANSVLREVTYRDGSASWWTMTRRGYLPGRFFGYAFACFVHLRRERNPAWMKSLRADALVTMRKGIEFLDAGAKTLMDFPIAESQTLQVLKEQLQADEASLRLAALWEVDALGPNALELMPLVVARLKDRDRTVRAAATKALAVFGDAARSVALEIVPNLCDRWPDVRSSAAIALNQLLPEPSKVVPHLCDLLSDSNDEVITAAAHAIKAYGTDSELVIRSALQAYLQSSNRCHFENMDALASILSAYSNLPQRIANCFPRWDTDQSNELAADILARVESLPGSE